MKKQRSKNLSVARQMPPLSHTIPGEMFYVKKSEVIQWLVEQPEILQYVFNTLVNHEIIYKPDTGKWQGADYHDR